MAKRGGALAGAAAAFIEGERNSSIAAQIGLRGAVQAWIDAPIDYAFRVAQAPDARVAEHLQQLAAANGLGNVNFVVNA